jgi:chromosome segregation ATPase
MTNPTEPHLAEAIPVTLMRIEGMVGGVAKDVANLTEKVTDIKAEVTTHRGQIGSLQSEMQQVRSDQATAAKDLKAADKAREDTAAALEKQTAEQVLKAKDAVDAATRQSEGAAAKSASIWSPFARMITVIVALTGAGVLLLMYVRG